jgi:hypothetical protein
MKAYFLRSPFEFIGRDLERVAVGIAEIDGVRNLVILEFEFDTALFQFALRDEEIFAVRAKSEVKHSKFAVTWRCRFCIWARRKQRNPGISFPNKSRHTIPHAFMKSLEAENFDIPVHRLLDVTHTESHVINSFELHKELRRT